jgi:tetratricopeptide (TPR) repeat protein
MTLDASGDRPGAIAEYREAIRLRPDAPEAHYNLGVGLQASGDLPGAAAEYREVIRSRPDLAAARGKLGECLSGSGDLPGAIAAFREAIRLGPDLAGAHCNLGLALLRQGRYAEALAELRVGHELGSKQADWPHPSARWVAEAERLAALADRLPAVLKGADRPANNAERLAFAQMAYDTKRYAVAARFWSEALESDPKLADEREAQHRYSAACAAALVASGKGEDDPKPDEDARARLRRQALNWLRAELEAWGRVAMTAGPGNKEAVATNLRHWREDPDLAGVRDEAALARLPEAERAEWKALWDEAGRLLAKCQTAP